MSLLRLQDVGKIYVSETNVAVGIRGVNLSFDRGEFVAVTGKSGCGKTTLLNVISGMDTYEEGEILIEGQPTSHYLQPDWEDYRQRYISFVFQDYNIIESFTVLQNVELSLMHIEDRKERRRRALELIGRVGLSRQIRQKGSRLSGGQKQRTVIARALAKDSPIILADEPTGNLDSATSAEIIALLHEVSRDKLLIVVTHNFEEVEPYATRHVRMFDGAVAEDQTLRAPAGNLTSPTTTAPAEEDRGTAERLRSLGRTLRNGCSLGRVIFFSKPRLSLFLCLLLMLGTFGIFSVTSMCGEIDALYRDSYLFNNIEGRVVIARQDGTPLSEEELRQLSLAHSAESYLHYDVLLDATDGSYFNAVREQDVVPPSFYAGCTYGETFGTPQIGRYPAAADEVFLYLPISLRPELGEKELLVDRVAFSGLTLRVCGVSYYVDNNLSPRALFTEEGFRTATAVFYLSSNLNLSITVPGNGELEPRHFEASELIPSFTIPEDRIYLDVTDCREYLEKHPELGAGVSVDLTASYINYAYGYQYSATQTSFREQFSSEWLTDEAPDTFVPLKHRGSCLLVSDELIRQTAEEVLARSYRQASLFFADARLARDAADAIRASGVYLAVPADTPYEPPAWEVLAEMLGALFLLLVWIAALFFLAFFISLCSGRVLEAFKNDMAIMRSMGISVRVIRVAMYVRMLLALLPAIAFVIGAALLIYTTPKFNAQFRYLYAWQYAVIFLGMLLLTLRTTHKQIRRLFGESVRKALKGGAEK